MEFQEVAEQGKQEKWYGLINFTLAVYVDSKWHQYKYCIYISEEDRQAVWISTTPESEQPLNLTAVKPPEPKAGDSPQEPNPADKPPESKSAEEPPPEGKKPRKKIGYTKVPPPPPENSVVDDFCFFSASRLLPTSARIKILDPSRSPAKAVWAELTFLGWLHGAPPRIVFLRPSRIYTQYRFQDFSFWIPPPPPPPPRKRMRFRIAP